MGFIREYADLFMVLAICTAVGAYTIHERHEGAAQETARIEKNTTKQVYKIQEGKNEIRNRAAGHALSIKRMQKYAY